MDFGSVLYAAQKNERSTNKDVSKVLESPYNICFKCAT